MLRIYINYFISVFLWSILNPYGFIQTLRQATGQLISISRAIIKDVVYDDSICFVLPFEGSWRVYNGGLNKQTSHSWSLIGQRYAYDFVIVNEFGKTYQDSPNRPCNYLAFGKSILAASDGVVVDLRQDIRDYHRPGTGWIDIKTPDMRGNYVVIKHNDARYTLYAHLKAHSITVQIGEAVVTGQKIGECGNSGHSSEPHLHFQLQDRADFYTAVSLPVKFRNFERTTNNRSQSIKEGYIQRDQIVKSANTCVSEITETENFVKPRISDLLISFITLFFTLLGVVVIMARIVEIIHKFI